MHALSYQCPPAIRTRIHETNLPDARNAYVRRCLTCTDIAGGGGNDLYLRVNALKDVQSSLTRYVTSTRAETKELTDKQVTRSLSLSLSLSLSSLLFSLSHPNLNPKPGAIATIRHVFRST
jgi:hypothetical protein